LPKYSVVSKLWEATEKVLRDDNICANLLQGLDCFLGMNKLPTN